MQLSLPQVPIVQLPPPPPPCKAVGLALSDPPSGTIRQVLSHPNHPPTPGTQPVLQTWFGGANPTCSSNLPFPLFRHHHHVLRWDWHQITLWYHKTRLHIQLPTTYPRDATSVADVVRGQLAHAAQILPFHCSATTTMCCGGIGTDPPSGTIRQGFTSKLPTPHSQGRNQCCRRGLGPIRHMQLKFYRSNCSATTTMCCGIGTSDPPSGTIRQGFHIQLPHTPIQGRIRRRRGSGPIGTCSSFYRSTVPPPPPCAAGLALQIHPLVP
jgi:hypothetical protein